jgi:hypothetical protein
MKTMQKLFNEGIIAIRKYEMYICTYTLLIHNTFSLTLRTYEARWLLRM